LPNPETSPSSLSAPDSASPCLAVSWTENLVLQVLAPAKGNDERLADDRSLVLRTKIGEFTLLHTFDSGFHTERDLLRSGADLSADIWIRGQHVESPSGSPEFLDAINPKIVISSHSKFPASQRVLGRVSRSPERAKDTPDHNGRNRGRYHDLLP
jgi:beta-lactamase superfamily II metal-dependent hydrolase